MTDLRPADLCRELLATVEASEGRRKRRKRDTSADAIGLGIKRELLEGVIRDDPPPEALESWLARRCLEAGPGDGPMRAMARSIWDEWRLAGAAVSFREWLERGAPSADR